MSHFAIQTEPKHDLPDTMRAVVLYDESEPPKLKVVTCPRPCMGSAVIRVLAANTVSYMNDIYNGERKYAYPKPLIPGLSSISRVAAVPPDATKLQSGDLVVHDCLIRSRDNPADAFLSAISHGWSKGSEQLMANVYRDGAFAEYCLVPIETLTKLDERKLTGRPSDGGLNLSLEDLAFLVGMAVPFGGMKDIELQPGQTIIVAPATGPFGGFAVRIAMAMGARVIAMGRNEDILATIKKSAQPQERIETVPITGDLMADLQALKQHGEIDAFFDIGPPSAINSTHIKSCILALRHGGRVSLMGGYGGDIAIPHFTIMHRNLRLYGKWMYERSDVTDLVKLVETGMLRLGAAGNIETEAFPLEKAVEAWERAAVFQGYRSQVVIKP